MSISYSNKDNENLNKSISQYQYYKPDIPYEQINFNLASDINLNQIPSIQNTYIKKKKKKITKDMIDPLDLMGNENLTRIELLEKYRSLSNIFNPECGGNKNTYMLIQKAIKYLDIKK